MRTSVTDYRDGLNVKLIEEILKMGYLPASATNWIDSVEYLEEHERDVVAIAEKHPSLPPKKRLFGLIKVKSRRRIIATIWLQNASRGAQPKRWVVETSGRQYLGETTQLIDTLSKKFGARAQINMKSDAPTFEAKASDYDI